MGGSGKTLGLSDEKVGIGWIWPFLARNRRKLRNFGVIWV